MRRRSSRTTAISALTAAISAVRSARRSSMRTLTSSKRASNWMESRPPRATPVPDDAQDDRYARSDDPLGVRAHAVRRSPKLTTGRGRPSSAITWQAANPGSSSCQAAWSLRCVGRQEGRTEPAPGPGSMRLTAQEQDEDNDEKRTPGAKPNVSTNSAAPIDHELLGAAPRGVRHCSRPGAPTSRAATGPVDDRRRYHTRPAVGAPGNQDRSCDD